MIQADYLEVELSYGEDLENAALYIRKERT